MTIVFMQLQSSKVSAVTFPSRQLSKDAVTFLSRKLWSGPEIRVKIGKYSSARLQIVVLVSRGLEEYHVGKIVH